MDFDHQLDPSTITDVETAKLALRWAVEKIHTLSDDNARLKEDNRNKTNIARSLTQQGEQKDEILKKWQSTIKTWEENWKTQSAMETDLKSKMREQILNEETANWRQAKAQLENEIKAIKNELAAKEAEIGRLKLHAIDEIRKAAELKDEENQAIMRSSRDALAEREAALHAKYERFEKEFMESRRLAAEQEDLALRERYETKMREFSLLYKTKEDQLEKFRQSLENDYIAKAEALTAERAAALDEERRSLAEKAEAALAEAEEKTAARIKTLQDGFNKQRELMRSDFEEKERTAAEEKERELTILKEANQKELSGLRDRLRQHMQQREQEYVDLRLKMESQLLDLIKKHDDASAEAWREAAEAAREKWSRLAVENQKKLDDVVNAVNARWQADWAKRETEAIEQRDALIASEKERLAAEFRTREEALRKTLLREQNERAAAQAAELEKAKLDLEHAHEERLEAMKRSLNESYAFKERTLEERLAAAHNKMRNDWTAKEEEWVLEKDHALLEEKEKLKTEFSGYRNILKEKFSQFEDELKLKYAHRELELEDKLKAAEVELEKNHSIRLQEEKQRLTAEFEAKKRELSRKESELEKNCERSVQLREEELAARAAEELGRRIAEAEKTLKEKMAIKETELSKEYAAKADHISRERADLMASLAQKEEALLKKEEEMRADFERRLGEEKTRIENGYKSHELHLEAKAAELDKLKGTLQQHHSELKIKLYQELQEKESEQLDRLAKAKEEMFRALNERRAVLDKEYEQRMAGLRDREISLQAEFDRKTEEWVKSSAAQKADELDALRMEFASRSEELEKTLASREKLLNAAYSDKLAKTETDCAAKLKESLSALEKEFQRRREGLETQHRHQAFEMENKYSEMARKLTADFERQREAWELQKAGILEKEKQALEAEVEKHDALMNRKLEEEISRSKDYKLQLEEEFDKRKQELEKEHYRKLGEARSALEKMRKEHETRMQERFAEMGAEQNRMTMWMFQKEEEYVKKYEAREAELLRQWESREKAFKESYEKKIQELESRSDGK